MLLVGTLAGFLAWGWSGVGAQPSDGSRASDDSTASTASPGTAREDAPAAEATPPARHAVAASVRVSGSCVSAEEGVPIPDCLLQIRVVFAKPPGASDDDARPEVERETTTGADGAFDLQIDVPADAAHVTRAYCFAARSDRARILAYAETEGTAAPHLDFGQLVLPRGAQLRGIVVDEAGLPVPGASFGLADMVLPGVPVLSPGDFDTYEVLEAGPDGEFASDAPLAFGTWLAEYDTPGRYLASPSELVFRDAGQRFRVVLAQAAALRGIVVDEQGRPIEGVKVKAVVDSLLPLSTESQPDGAFELFADRKVDGEVNVYCSASGHDCIEDLRPVRWGRSDLRIVMRPKQRGALRIRVVAEGSQQPVQAQVRAHSRKATTDAAGFALLDELAVGTHDCAVRPTDPRLRPAVVQGVEIRSRNMTERLVQLAALESLEVRVEDTAHRAIAGALVRVADTGMDWPSSRDDSTVRIDLPSGPADGEATRRTCLVLAEALTDASGHCTLSAPAHGNDGILLVDAPGHLPLRAAAPWPRDANGRVTLTLSAGAVLRGELRNLDPAWIGAIRLCRPPVATVAPQTPAEEEEALIREHLRTWSDAQAASVDASGQFAIDLLEPGPWEVTVHVLPAAKDREAVAWGGAPLPLRIDPVNLKAGETKQLTIDASSMRAANIRGTLTLGGEVPPACTLRVGQPFPSGFRNDYGDAWSTKVGISGQFELRGVPPGEWLPSVSLGLDSLRSREIEFDDVWMLGSGESVERRISVPIRTVRVRVLKPDRTPAAGVQVGVAGLMLMATTDAGGTAVFGPCPRRQDHVVTVEPTVLHDIEFPRGGGELFREVILK